MGFDKDFSPVLRFMVCSDVHIKDFPSPERERFKKAILTSYDLASSQPYPRLDAVYVVGDFANSGTPLQMNITKQIIDETVKGDTVFNLSVASHEFGYNGEIMAKKRLKRIFGNEASTHRVINGFHFISIGCTRGCLFDEPQRDFLRKSLCEAAADDPEKPIFVFQHPHIQDTVYGSIAWGDDGLTDILISYPQVIDFSGHSHAPINDPRSIHQRHFTCLGTGSLSYFELDEFDKSEGTVPSDGRECAQMLIVEADACGNVRVYPYDLITMNFFPYTWKIDTPWNPDSFLYTDERYSNAPVPFFEEGSVLTATVGENSVSLTFPQAKSSEKYINSYEIVVKDPSGIIRRKFNMFNKYYLYNMPDVLTAEIKDLPGGIYYAEVYATGFFKTKSKKPLACEMFTIQ